MLVIHQNQNPKQSNISVTFKGDDLLLPRFLLRYIDKARKIPGYEAQVSYLEEVIKQIKEETTNGVIPRIPRPTKKVMEHRT